jgi:hypothetical protein
MTYLVAGGQRPSATGHVENSRARLKLKAIDEGFRRLRGISGNLSEIARGPNCAHSLFDLIDAGWSRLHEP